MLRRPTRVVAVVLGLVALAAACSSSSPASAVSLTTPSSTWLKMSIDTFDHYAPDSSALYYTTLFDTMHGDRTVITGTPPKARYWSLTAYRLVGGAIGSIDDQKVTSSSTASRYRVVLASSCAGITGTCLATGSTTVGSLVYRMYVPDDLTGAQTGDVPLPATTYLDHDGVRVSVSVKDLPRSAQQQVSAVERLVGHTQRSVLEADPTDGPVTASGTPKVVIRAGGEGPFSNPDNIYFHVNGTMAHGDLVLRGAVPTYRAQSAHPANTLGRTDGSEQVRYWSICTQGAQSVTIDCLRDEQVVLPSRSNQLVLVVAPTCPVAGYANCLPAGEASLQKGVLYRNLLPAKGFTPYTGPYRLTATYIDRK